MSLNGNFWLSVLQTHNWSLYDVIEVRDFVLITLNFCSFFGVLRDSKNVVCSPAFSETPKGNDTRSACAILPSWCVLASGACAFDHRFHPRSPFFSSTAASSAP